MSSNANESGHGTTVAEQAGQWFRVGHSKSEGSGVVFAILLTFACAAFNCWSQQLGTAVVPADIVKTTLLIESRQIVKAKTYVPVPSLLLVIQQQPDGPKPIPPTNLFAFVEVEQTNYAARGSGLVVAYSNLVFLVTAGHVIPPDEDVYYRIPGKNGGEPQHVPHKAVAAFSRMNWVRADDVDLAATIISCDFEKSDVRAIPLDDSIAAYDGVAVGDEVFVVGYPSSVASPANPSIHFVRSGTVSSKSGNGGLLIDAFTFPGNSGGPVFWKPSVGFEPGPFVGGPKLEGRPPRLVGIVQGYLPYQEQAVSTASGRTRVTFEENSGLSIVISSSKILDLFRKREVTETIIRLRREQGQPPTQAAK